MTKKLLYSRLNDANQAKLRQYWEAHQWFNFVHCTGSRRRAQANAVVAISKQSDGVYRHSMWHVPEPVAFEYDRKKRSMTIPVVVDVRY